MTDIKKDSLTGENQALSSYTNESYDVIGMLDLDKSKPKLLLHSCCGPCSTAVIERLLPEYSITVFFYNPNITDPDEYEKRLRAQLEVIEYFNKSITSGSKISFIEGKYESDKYFEMVSGFEDEKEGGKRCSICFDMRLEETAKVASENKFDTFTTTLTVSPHKSYDIISQIGKDLGEKYQINYLDGNFKKKDGFKRSIELSKQLNLYRQNYCGCQFSVWEK